VHLGPAVLKLPARGREPGPAKLAARPSRIEIHEPDAPGTLPGTLEKITYVGSHLEFVVGTEFGEIFVVSPNVDAAFQAGRRVGIGFPARGPVLLTD
nr:TOBE domain-containing protein [Pseudaminobacter sp.]